MMSDNEAGEAFKASLFEILPELSSREISPTDRLRDLGANSIDRAEIIMLTLARLKLKIPLIHFAQANNIGALIEIIQHHLATSTASNI
jgi:polyketide biosynthesis acyl carrier protein